ncbi:hypothetical protein ACA910_002958 [Epithemia clementina (nom. ined.)]
MDPAIRPYSGVDASPFRAELESNVSAPLPADRPFWLRWERLFMRMTPSPYNAVTHFYLAEELARGSPTDPSNPCRFDEVRLNIPGSENYDPTLPWIMKWNVEANALAGDVVTFVDDLRATGHSTENAWQVGRRVASRLQWLGLQDAPRKRGPPSQTPGAWAGSVFKISKLHICKTTTQEKWENGKARLKKYVEAFHEKAYPCFDFKTMRSDVGFFVHQAMTYSCIMPFLKGFFLTMDMWRGKRDKEGWKMSKKEWILQLLDKIEEEEGSAIAHEILDSLDDEKQKHSGLSKSGQDPLIYQQENPPNQVMAVERLKDDVHAIASMFSNSTPPEVGIRSLEIFLAIYGFGDASGKGFGSAIQGDKGLSYRIGVWAEHKSNESSNWREFSNCVSALEEEAKKGNLGGKEVFFFTDNTTVEACCYKGSSSSKRLLSLIIRLRAMEMTYSIRLHLSHVSGKRMIAQGADGLSRGSVNEGVMDGTSMLSFIPLHKNAYKQSPLIWEWVISWMGEEVERLEPRDWYERAHDIETWRLPHKWEAFEVPDLRPGKFVWFPPPGAADAAIDELCKARNKRQLSTHIFICLCLLTMKWFKQLHKAADIVFEVPAASRYWPKSNFEPLIVAICFPFIRHPPWQLRSSPKMFAVERELH